MGLKYALVSMFLVIVLAAVIAGLKANNATAFHSMDVDTKIVTKAQSLSNVRRKPQDQEAELFPVTITSYLNAYDMCCGKNGNTPPKVQCTQQDDEWFSRLMKKFPIVSTGKATLYWAHMRKGGGTSFGSAIESQTFNRTHEPGALFTNGFVRTVKMHLQAGSRHCIDHQYANETLFVTIIRHPVDRYVSEYFYQNMGKKLTADTIEGKILEWHELSKNNGKKKESSVIMRKAIGTFIENWQTRWYTNPQPCEDLNRPPPHDSHKNYSYWNSGHKLDPRKVVSRRDLDDAKMILDNFDVVGMAPFFGGECSIVD
jgi:hypothetical protein